MQTTGRDRAGWVAAGGLGVVGAAVILVVALGGSARTSASVVQQMAPAGDHAALVARGEYLANSVAMCVQCHSTRDEAGNIIESQKFRGGAIPVQSPYKNVEWALRAPNIANLPGFTDEQFIELLTTGQASGRTPPRRPMPPFRMAKPDAEALLAYLRSR